MEKNISTRKKIPLEELKFIFSLLAGRFGYLICEIMLKKKIFFNKEEIAEGRRLLGQQRTGLICREGFKELVDASEKNIVKNEEPKTPLKKKVLFKESEDRLVKLITQKYANFAEWIKECGKYQPLEFYNAIEQYGDSSEIPQISAVNKYIKKIDIKESLSNTIFNVIDECMDNFSDKMPHLYNIGYFMLDKYILGKKEITYEDIEPITDSDIRPGLSEVCMLMNEYKMVFREEDIPKLKENIKKIKVSSNIRTYKELVHKSEMFYLVNKKTTIPKSKKSLLKESEGLTWKELVKISFDWFQNRSKEEEEIINEYLDAEIPNLKMSDFGRYEIPSILIVKILVRYNKFTEKQKDSILEMKSGFTNLEDLFEMLKKKIERERKMKKVMDSETTTPKNKALGKFKGKLNDEIRISSVLDGLYEEINETS